MIGPPRVRGRSRATVDATLCLVIFAILAVQSTLASDARGPAWANLACAAAIGVGLWWRRRRPLVAVVVFLAAAAVLTAWLTPINALVGSVMLLALLGYAICRHSTGRERLAGIAVSTAGVMLVTILVESAPASEHNYVNDVLFPLVILGGGGVVGYALHNRAQLARELAERNERLELERELREQAAVLDERRRIARELHDVVAHTVSVMVVQAGAARRTLDRDPARALDALGAVEATGRGALVELRRLLGLLRTEGAEASRAPQPGLAGVGTLVERARAAGLPVELVVEGEPSSLPAGVDLAAYRVVQEALTNTLKHAGPAHARVRVRWADEEVGLEVTDTGRGADARDGEGGGHGLVGMRERVAMYGGELHAGPVPGGGFGVHVRLPRARAVAEAAA